MTAPPVLPSTDDTRLLDFLRDRDVLCPLCQYNLRNLTVPRCPECGRGLRLSVGLTEPYLAAWIAGMLALAASGGIGILFLLATLRHGGPDHMPWLELLAGLYYALCIPLASLWLISRRRILRWTTPQQWTFAVLAIGGGLAAIALLFARP